MPDFRPFTADDALATAASALSQAWGEPVHLEAPESLGKEERRNLILRAQATGSFPTRSVIIKATRAASYDPAAKDAYRTFGFTREWAAVECLARRPNPRPLTPTLLAHDIARGVLVYEDLDARWGTNLPSLVEPLLHGTPEAAEQALTAYASALASLHAATLGSRADHAAVLKEGFPNTNIPRPAHNWPEAVARPPHTLLGGPFPEAEIDLIHQHLKQPSPWQALVHNDPCPDNILLTPNGGVALLDFEFATIGHALFDAAYWRMAFPSCWCAGTIPAAVAARIENTYRTTLAQAVPEAADDDAYRRESALIDCARCLISLSWLLQDALAEDTMWGRATRRSRIITYLQLSIRSAEFAGILPGVRGLFETWLKDLKYRWPDTGALVDFPAFGR